MIDASTENARVLASVFGVDEDQATELLAIRIVVTHDGSSTAAAIAFHIKRLLARTICAAMDASPAVEIVIGHAKPRLTCTRVVVGAGASMIQVGAHASPGALAPLSHAPALVVACYAAASALRVALATVFRLPFTDPVEIDASLFDLPSGRVDIGRVHLAGAGAIGNGFLYGLVGSEAEGEVVIVDPKDATPGNLNRCVWFEQSDLGRPKAVALAERAAVSLPRVRLVAKVTPLQHVDTKTAGPWLERLVVAVDSRRARRHLQEELPREIFDASTTGIEEIVFHFNDRLRPSCLTCTYYEDAHEHAHAIHVAEVLGVTLDDVLEERIGPEAAARIAARHHLDPDTLVGRAYDSLFKALCGAGEIPLDSGRTVLAPFAFVSTLAGVVLAVEFLRRVASGKPSNRFTAWRISPWSTPFREAQRLAKPRSNCPACANALIRETVGALWGSTEAALDGTSTHADHATR